MESETANSIANSAGCYFRYDDALKFYTLYVGQSWAHIKPKDLEKLDEVEYRDFIINFMRQEAEDILKYGITVN